MVREDADELPLDADDNRPPIQCEDCQSVLHGTGTESVAFLLVDQHTIPLASCPVHREQFRSICELTTEGSAELLEFRPAGGVPCQPCRLATHNPTQPIVPVTDGAVLVLACPRHQTQVIDRFYTGLQTQQELTTSLDSL